MRTIRDLIAAFPSESPHSAYVAQHGALPLYVSWGATIGITPKGKIVEWSTEGDYEGLRPADPSWVISALVQGSKKWPALTALIPPRPPTAHTCPDCHGTGRIHGVPENIADGVGCSCRGVGWIEPQVEERRSMLSRLRDRLPRLRRRDGP
ncbi:hypothetical protein [Paludisphaera borealis]|nr:hypothetical protein [Paludisphaera borealis]